MFFFNEALFYQTKEFSNMMKEIDSYVVKDNPIEIFHLINKNHKFVKLHAKFKDILNDIKEMINPKDLKDSQLSYLRQNKGKEITRFLHVFKSIRKFFS